MWKRLNKDAGIWACLACQMSINGNFFSLLKFLLEQDRANLENIQIIINNHRILLDKLKELGFDITTDKDLEWVNKTLKDLEDEITKRGNKGKTPESH